MNTARGDVIRDEKSIVKSLVKALSLLECFSPDNSELSIAELAELTGVQKATCNRLVTTMTDAGWLGLVDGNRYAPTVKLFRLGSTAIQRIDLRHTARPWLERLVETFGDSAYLMVLDGLRVICLDRQVGDNPLQLNGLDVGMSMPFNLGAAPLAILAHRDDLLLQLDQSVLPAYTDHTITTLVDLRRRLAEVRERGYALSQEDYARGVGAVGAPVFDHQNIAVAAISLGGVASGFTPPRLDEIVNTVIEAASSLSNHLGHDDKVDIRAVVQGGPS